VKNIKTNKFKCNKKEDVRCFEYALESILNPVEKHTDRPTNYNITKYEKLNMEYPIELIPEKIEKYENFINHSINIYKYDENESIISLYYRSQNFNKEGHINLLMYKDHIVGIKNLSALLRGQIHKYTHHVNICMKCHRKFELESDYNSHIESCVNGKQNIQMPSKTNNIRKYYSFGAEQYHPYTITLDFECTLKKCKNKSQRQQNIFINMSQIVFVSIVMKGQN